MVTALAERGIEAAPGEVLAFLAAVLSSRGYVERFGPALALDYPRVPLPRDAKLFASLASHGEALERALSGSAEMVAGRSLAGPVVRVGHHGGDRHFGPGDASSGSDLKDNTHWFTAQDDVGYIFNIHVMDVNPNAGSSTGRVYLDPNGEKLSDGTIRARRVNYDEVNKLYG